LPVKRKKKSAILGEKRKKGQDVPNPGGRGVPPYEKKKRTKKKPSRSSGKRGGNNANKRDFKKKGTLWELRRLRSRSWSVTRKKGEKDEDEIVVQRSSLAQGGKKQKGVHVTRNKTSKAGEKSISFLKKGRGPEKARRGERTGKKTRKKGGGKRYV